MDEAKALFSRLKDCERLPAIDDATRPDAVNRRIKYLTSFNPAFANKHWVIVRHMAEYGYFYDIACRKYLVKIETETEEKLSEQFLARLRKRYKSYDDSKKLFDKMYEFYISGGMPFEKALTHYSFIMGSAMRASYYYELQYEIHKRRNGRAKMAVRDYQAKALESLKDNLIIEAMRERAAILEVREEQKKVKDDKVRNILEWFRDD